MMHIGICTIYLRLPEARSLKEKRRVIKSIKDRIGNKFNVSIAEVDKLDKSGIAVDFTILKAYLKNFLPDHQVLNDVYDFSPSAENLSEYFFNTINKDYPVSKVTVWESDNAAASYSS